jgi:hypothetical protein
MFAGGDILVYNLNNHKFASNCYQSIIMFHGDRIAAVGRRNSQHMQVPRRITHRSLTDCLNHRLDIMITEWCCRVGSGHTAALSASPMSPCLPLWFMID